MPKEAHGPLHWAILNLIIAVEVVANENRERHEHNEHYRIEDHILALLDVKERPLPD
jgi:hypothetical protein